MDANALFDLARECLSFRRRAVFAAATRIAGRRRCCEVVGIPAALDGDAAVCRELVDEANRLGTLAVGAEVQTALRALETAIAIGGDVRPPETAATWHERAFELAYDPAIALVNAYVACETIAGFNPRDRDQWGAGTEALPPDVRTPVVDATLAAIADLPLDEISAIERNISLERAACLAMNASRPAGPVGPATLADDAAAILSRVSLVAGETSTKIIQIANSDEPSDRRMRLIAELDPTYWGWKSPAWAKLLRITGNSVRKTDFWKIDRPKHFEDAVALWRDRNSDADELPPELRSWRDD